MQVPIPNLYHLYRRHLECLLLPFQPIYTSREELDNVRAHKYWRHYLFPLTIVVGICVDILLNWNAPSGYRGHYHLYILTFTFPFELPEAFFREAGITFAFNYGLSFFPNFLLLFDHFQHKDFILLYDNNQLSYPYRKPKFQFIDNALSRKLMKFWFRCRGQTKRIVTFLALQMDIGFFYPLVVTESYKIYISKGQNILSFRSAILLLICFFYMRTIVNSIHMGIQFMCTNYIIQIKQIHYLEGLKMDHRIQKVQRAYRKWYLTIKRVLDVTREIDAMGRFYSKYVTVLIIIMGMIGCTILNTSVRQASQSPLFQLLPWLIFGSLFLCFTLLFNTFSSRTQYLNFKLFKTLRQYQILILSKPGLNRNQIVKLDLINEYKIFLQKCSFKLLNSAAINNKLFAFQIFGGVSVFWMKLVSHESFFEKS